ncbi:hypothetical protein DID74_01310 [Candidatus Marinamargulisbacteria bacterium SCGC AG-333-B06]|nr:hypothetical protein DID74_01310 [Candidatus Marinamargulisbacteria bacterium SCGC AG-333-B06]
MRLIDLIETVPKAIFLIDASGVLYSNNGFIKESAKTFQYLQKQGPTFLASNNSYHYPNDIAHNLFVEGTIKLNPDHIISSGHGLAKDPIISNIITDKIIYFIGPKAAEHYALDAPIKGITQQLEHAEAIILAGFNENQSTTILDKIITIAKKNPSLPIICCNKDRHIRAKQGLQPVVGYYAEKLESQLNSPLYWFGKPLKNFSNLVKTHLKTHKLNPHKSTLFFDDNLENVISMQNHLGISGCWIKETGILYKQDEDTLLKKFGKPTYSLATFNLTNTLTIY